MAILCFMMVGLLSCSGEDGERGPQGSIGAKGMDGSEGSNGTNGEDGTDGVDGNANVFSFVIDMGEWAGGQVYPFQMPIDIPDRANYTFLFYLEYIPNQFTVLHPVPGAALNVPFRVEVTYSNTEQSPGGVLTFRDYQGAFFEMPPGFYLNLIIVAMEENPLAGKNGSTSLREGLKAAGVDADDYHAVAAYFGLD